MNFLNNIAQDLNIEFLNLTMVFENIAKRKLLHIYNKNDTHFNKFGFMQYVKSTKRLINL